MTEYLKGIERCLRPYYGNRTNPVLNLISQRGGEFEKGIMVGTMMALMKWENYGKHDRKNKKTDTDTQNNDKD